MLPISALKNMNVMFATPCYSSATTSPYTVSIFGLAGQCAVAGMNCMLHHHSESLVTDARNKMLMTFWQDKSNFTHLFWIDSDIKFTPESVFRLLLADKDVVAGVYPLKEYVWPASGLPQGMTRVEFETQQVIYPFSPIVGTSHPDPFGFAEVRETTTGFMCIKRSVIAKMIEAYGDLTYIPDATVSGYKWGPVYRFFDIWVDPVSKRFLSEDYAFCKLWREIGGQVFVDVNSRFGHLGQHLFQGDLSASLCARSAENLSEVA